MRRHRRRAGRRLRKGEVPILEDGLPELVDEGLASRAAAVRGRRRARGRATAEIVFLCVPTPQGDDGSADLSLRRGRSPGRSRRSCAPGAVVVNKSTVPVGSTRLRAADPGRGGRAASSRSRVASNPEFLREGSAVRDFLHPDRIVIGCDDPAVGGARQRALPRRRRAGARHRPGVGRDDQVRVERVPRDEDLVHQRDREPLRGGRRRRARGRDRHGLRPRASASSSCTPVPGYGGSCFPKDVAALLHTARRRATTSSCSTAWSTSTRASTSAWSTRCARLAGGDARRRARSRSGASPSRPTPTTCATRRRS